MKDVMGFISNKIHWLLKLHNKQTDYWENILLSLSLTFISALKLTEKQQKKPVRNK